jgi:HEAT repeat protein
MDMFFFKPNVEKMEKKRDEEGLIKALRYKDPWVRRAAVKALGKIGDPRAIEPLITALKDENRDVREEAAWALGELGDPRAVEPLIRVFRGKYKGLETDLDKEIHKAAAEALMEMRSAAAEAQDAGRRIGNRGGCRLQLQEYHRRFRSSTG